jgi:hypothetical protein
LDMLCPVMPRLRWAVRKPLVAIDKPVKPIYIPLIKTLYCVALNVP